ncbi:MAG TPA: DUF6226 family protein [Acidimicrobiales bacterium]|nr:DUF6226 family protein [Acidimicrobiales bacterium]
MTELERAVDAAFVRTGRGLSHWPDPHPDRAPLDEEYSRSLDPLKWRIVPAWAEAWCDAAVELGIATLERACVPRWAVDDGARYRRVDRLIPNAVGALPMTLAYAGSDGERPTGVTIALGHPAVVFGSSPACGCDACDAGSQNELDHLDAQVRDVVSGQVRHLSAADRTIVASSTGWSATGSFGRSEVDEVLADPKGWVEVSGASWLDG